MPGIRAIRSGLHVGQDKASEVQAYLEPNPYLDTTRRGVYPQRHPRRRVPLPRKEITSMTNQPDDRDPNAEVAIPDPTARAACGPRRHQLRDRARRPARARHAGLRRRDQPGRGRRLPVIPKHLRTRGVKAAARYHAGRHAHRAAYHGLRSPRYLLLALFWSVVGVFRLIGRQIAWWHLLEQHGLRSQAAADGDSREWSKLHKQAQETRKVRGIILAFEVAGVLVAGFILARFSPWWGWALVAASCCRCWRGSAARRISGSSPRRR